MTKLQIRLMAAAGMAAFGAAATAWALAPEAAPDPGAGVGSQAEMSCLSRQVMQAAEADPSRAVTTGDLVRLMAACDPALAAEGVATLAGRPGDPTPLVQLGPGANDGGDDSRVAVGQFAFANAANAIAVGRSAFAGTAGDIAIGRAALAMTGASASSGFNRSGVSSTALGHTAFAVGERTTAIGAGAVAAGNFSEDSGRSGEAATHATAIGAAALADRNATSVGAFSLALPSGTAIGYDASAVNSSVAIGRSARATNSSAISIGRRRTPGATRRSR